LFNKIITWIKEVVNKMFNKTDMQEAFNTDISVSNEMIQAISLWSEMYENKAPWLDENIKSLNLPASIASELARMVTIEFKSEITGSKRADFLNEQYKIIKNKLRVNTEYGNAKGGIMFKPYVKDGRICTDYIQADSFVPTSFDDSGKIIGVIFTNQIVKGKYIYTRLEAHKYSNSNYLIENKVYKSESNSVLGKQVSMQEVEEWNNIQEKVLIINVDRPLFGYYKVPQANNTDTQSPLGVSVYARAVEDIKKADIQYGRLDWEYEASEKAIYADIVALKEADMGNNISKSVMPTTRDRLIKKVGIGKDDFYEDYSPEIRDEAFIRGLNKAKQEIEFKCGLAYGTISDPQAIEKSATEVKQGKQRSYATVSDMQKSLQNALDDLIYAMDVLATLYKLSPIGKYEASYEWDDSIIVDTESEQVIRSQEVTQGLSSKKKYLMWRYGLTEDQAQEMLDEIKAEQGPDTGLFNAE